MGEYLQEQYRNSIKELNDVEQKWREKRKKQETPNIWAEWYGQDEYSIKNCPKLNNKDQQWRKEHRKELQQSIDKLKSTILQEKSNDNK